MKTFSGIRSIQRYVVLALLAIALAFSAGGPVVADDWTSWGLGAVLGELPVAAVEFENSVYVFYNRLGSSSLICVGPSCTVPNGLLAFGYWPLANSQ